MQTVVHVTHEAIQKIGGIGAVLHGLLTSRVYLEKATRNILVGPGQANFDMALKKHFQISKNNEVSQLEFRSEFFNIFNHPNFSNPGNAKSTPSSFGTISSMSSSPRIIQFALKYQF